MIVKDVKRRIDERRSKEIKREWRKYPMGDTLQEESPPPNENLPATPVQVERKGIQLPDDELSFIDLVGGFSGR
jgi:hypothetical protein